MGSSVGTALGIIGIIIGAGAIGFAFFVWNSENTTNSGLKADLDDLTDQLNNLTGSTNMTGPTNMTAAFNNLTDAFNDLTDEFNNLTDEFNNLESEFSNLTRTIVVGNWEGLARNIAANPSFGLENQWLFRFHTETYLNSDYISISNVNTRITLSTAGWYRIHISTHLSDLDPGNYYSIEIYKNGVNQFILNIFDVNSGDPNKFYVDSSAFIYSDGTDYYEISGESGADPFSPGLGGSTERFTIEYVAI